MTVAPSISCVSTPCVSASPEKRTIRSGGELLCRLACPRVDREPDLPRVLDGQAVEDKGRKQTHHPMGNECARDGERVLLREVMIGRDVDPASNPSELARSDKFAQPVPADPKGGKITAADHAAVADCLKGMSW